MTEEPRLVEAPGSPSPGDEDPPPPPSLAQRLRQPRTIISIAVPLIVIAVFVYLNRDTLGTVPGLILQANPLLFLAAFGIYYLGFPLRGYRWHRLLKGTGTNVSTRDATEILFLSWLVNCVVPAKLGDVYRAYLLKINTTASLSRTFGTVFIERILDLLVIAILGLGAGFWSFRTGLPPSIQLVAALGVVVVIVLGGGLLTMRNFGRSLITRLPLPHRIIELYDRFEEGVFGAIASNGLPLLIVNTVLIWGTESLRLYLVVQALHFPNVELGLSGAVFVALIGSLLTAVPLSPAGLGIVEAGVVGVLTAAYGVPLPEATAIALLDRVISVFSIIVLGSIVYLVSKKPGGIQAPTTAETTAAG
jgi:glycosyltransferase 2 family protein